MTNRRVCMMKRFINKASVVNLLTVFLFLLLFVRPVSGQEAETSDWPMWRYDGKRSANSPSQLPDELHLIWKRQLETPKPAWPVEQYKLQFDKSYEPIVVGKTMFVASMVNDSVKAYDTETGRGRWSFYCRGPVRFAPAWYEGKIYFASDDGYLYCVDAEDGKLVWEKKLAPADNMVLGNGRLISAWPVRGAVVIDAGKIYCAAGVWPFMGIFIYCIDADTGEVVWENSRSGSVYIKQQHSSDAFAGVAPQGYMAVGDGKLLIPSRTVPACYDAKTGDLLYYKLSERDNGKYVGGYNVSIWNKWFFNNGMLYSLEKGNGLAKSSAQVAGSNGIIAFDPAGNLMSYTPSSTEKPTKEKTFKAKGLWKAEFEQKFDRIHIKAGNKLYASKDGQGIASIKTPNKENPASIGWEYNLEGKVWSMVTGDNKLFVVTESGEIYCFGGEKKRTRTFELSKKKNKTMSLLHRARTKAIMKSFESQGYCVLLEMGNKHLLKEMLEDSKLNIIVLEKDPKKAAAARKEFDKLGVYGTRVCIVDGDIDSVSLPPYFADVIVSEQFVTKDCDNPQSRIEQIFNLLRPFGGTAWLSADKDEQLELYGQITNANLFGSEIETDKWILKLTRAEGPAGSSDWTHQYGNAANTVCSDDELKLPLGILWFGENSEFTDVLPRHAHGPGQQVVSGRLFIEGVDSITARDVYTGKRLWDRQFENMNIAGTYFDDSYKPDFLDKSYNQNHIPGANTRGTNFVATSDKVYVLEENNCRVLDAATGELIRTFTLVDKNQSPREWAYIGIYNDLLIAGADFVDFASLVDDKTAKKIKWIESLDKSASGEIIIMNRHSGKIVWNKKSEHGFIHNGIIAGNGKLFCLDRIPQAISEQMQKGKNTKDFRLSALNIETGKVIWEKTESVFGSWLGYSEKYDILLQADRKSRDMVWQRGQRMNSYQGKSGAALWDITADYSGPCIINDNTIITQHKSFDLMTGYQRIIKHPLSGEPIPWNYSRNYGCGTVISSRNFLTFRSASAGFFDLNSDGGTGNFGGFRSGCTSNLIAANGVLNAPDYTRTCTCSYQIQTSLAMVHMPDVETWTFNDMAPATKRIVRMGINFGAPGDRNDDSGTLWMDYPSSGGKSPDPGIKVSGDNVKYFGKHSLRIKKGNLKWVESYGATGVDEITVEILPGKNKVNEAEKASYPYTVVLHFLEPVVSQAGQRIFDIALQDKIVMKNVDVFSLANGTDIGISKHFSGINIPNELSIKLIASDKSPIKETVICGVEIIAED